MSGITSLQFILFYSLFLFLVIQITGLMGENVISGVNPPSLPQQPTFLNYLAYPFENIGFFFKLMGASSSFAILGTIILTPFAIGIIWIILQLVRGSGS
jgi:hypothetical protein